MIIHLAFQRALDHDLRQPPQQAALTGQLQPLRTSPVSQLPEQLRVRPGHPCRVSSFVTRLDTCAYNAPFIGFVPAGAFAVAAVATLAGTRWALIGPGLAVAILAAAVLALLSWRRLARVGAAGPRRSARRWR